MLKEFPVIFFFFLQNNISLQLKKMYFMNYPITMVFWLLTFTHCLLWYSFPALYWIKKRQAETCTYFIWTNVSVLVCNLTMQSPCAVCMLRYILISNRLCSFKCGRKYPWLAFEKKKSLWSVENTNLIVPLNDFQTIFLNFTRFYQNIRTLNKYTKLKTCLSIGCSNPEAV